MIKTIKKINIQFLVYLLIFTAGIAFLLFNDYGLLKYWQMKDEIVVKSRELQKTRDMLESLKAEIDSLKNSGFKIEQVAREKYNLIRPGEKVINITEE